MLTQQIGLFDQTGTVDPATLASVAAAISIQISRDLSPFWPVSAAVQALPASAGVPAGCIPAYIVSDLPPGTSGVHLSNNNQPYIQVEAGPAWMLAASHEICEMLVDPSMNKLHAAMAISVSDDGTIADAEGQFEYLVEVCDPSADPANAYLINGYPMADFYTPHYFDSIASPNVRYSQSGAITGPRQVVRGGYLTWHDPLQGVWRMLDYVNSDPPQIIDLPGMVSADMTAAATLRQRVDSYFGLTRKLSAIPPEHELLTRASRRRHVLTRAGEANAAMYQNAITGVAKAPKKKRQRT